MKQNIKFILALGDSKLVMLREGASNTFYSKTTQTCNAKKTNLRRIASTLTQLR
jgi:hypothetical protein